MSGTLILSRGLIGLVDDADYDVVMNAGKWHAVESHRTFYVRRNTVRVDGTRGMVALHSFLTGWSLVDHANGDGLDNRRSNLRSATPDQNRANKRIYGNNSSGYKGVIWHAPTRRWRARIGVAGKKISLGLHPTREAAARAYDTAAIEYFGEFAALNFIGGSV